MASVFEIHVENVRKVLDGPALPFGLVRLQSGLLDDVFAMRPYELGLTH